MAVIGLRVCVYFMSVMCGVVVLVCMCSYMCVKCVSVWSNLCVYMHACMCTCRHVCVFRCDYIQGRTSCAPLCHSPCLIPFTCKRVSHWSETSSCFCVSWWPASPAIPSQLPAAQHCDYAHMWPCLTVSLLYLNSDLYACVARTLTHWAISPASQS